MDEKLLARLYSHRNITGRGCWEYTGSKDRAGYGHMYYKGKTYGVHRLVMGCPNGKQVNHRCDNTLCFNPDHLYIGDQRQNMKDCVRRKRHVSSRKTHCRKGHVYNLLMSRWSATLCRSVEYRACSICQPSLLTKKHISRLVREL
jgi:hypothetical protein